MSTFEKKEKNLNELINKLDVLTSTYSQSSYETEKIKTEKVLLQMHENWQSMVPLPRMFF